MQVAVFISDVLGQDVPIRVIGYDGSKAGPDRSDVALRILSPRALCPARHGAGHARARQGVRLERDRRRGRSVRGARRDGRHHASGPRPGRAVAARPQAAAALAAPPPARAGPRVPPAGAPALEVARPEGDLAPLRRLQPVLRVGARPVHGLHLRGLPHGVRHARGGAGGQARARRAEARAGAGHATARRRLRLGRDGHARRRRARGRGARRHALAQPGGVGAGGDRPPRARRAGRGAPPRLPGRAGVGVRRGQLHRAHRAHRQGPAAELLPLAVRPAAPRRAAAQPLHHPAPHTAEAQARPVHRPLRLPGRASWSRSGTSSRS